MIKLRYPNLSNMQVQRYLYQLVDDLNVALMEVEGRSSQGYGYIHNPGSAETATDEEAQATFNALKALIIKSADIVNAYCDVISNRLAGRFVAQSDFGVYVEDTAQEIKETSTAVERVYTNLQEIITDVENVEHSLIEVGAHMKSGLLYYDENGIPVYGLEIGQRSEVEGKEIFNKYARFTSEKLSFYDANDNEVAYISDKKLYISHVRVSASFSIGGFVDTVLPEGSVVTRWVEGGA